MWGRPFFGNDKSGRGGKIEQGRKEKEVKKTSENRTGERKSPK